MEGFTADLSTSSVETVVIGGGLAGLVVAHELRKRGRSVVVLEKDARPGGVVRSEFDNGYLLELGPNAVQSNDDLAAVIDDLKLGDKVVAAPKRMPRYVLYKRRLCAVPLSPLGLLSTRLLSLSGKWRLLREPWTPANPPTDDETLLDFSERRIGPEATERLLAPFIAGSWTSDVSTLSACGAFPKLCEWEQKYGSVARGALKSRKQKPATPTSLPRGIVGFENGLSTLTGALAKALDGLLFLKTAPTRIHREDAGWNVETDDRRWRATNVVMATPAPAAAALLKETAPFASAALDLIPYAPLTLMHMGFKPGELLKRHKGFGYLTLPRDRPDILGCIWTSDIFPGRAPAGHTLLTIFIGGSLNPAMAEMADRPLEDHVINALNTVMNVRVRPAFQRITRYSMAIPQYTLGHAHRMDILAKAERDNPGLYFAGNIRGGIAVGDVIRSSRHLASLFPSPSL
jgi:oxygen-dependent protoporphyrinogen oxidase